MAHHHGHSHIPHDHKGRNLGISIFLNILITLAQVVGGLISGSLSLLSDALHNFTDVVSLVISYVAQKLTRRKASIERTFGYKRAEIMAAFVNAASLIIVALVLIKEAVERFLEPEPVTSSWVIWLSILAIAGNGFSVLLLRKDAEDNMNMKSAYLHLLTDMMASVAVLVGGLLMKFFQWYWVDPTLTLAIAIYLVFMGYGLLKESARVLMLFTPSTIDVKDIVTSIIEMGPIKNVHHVHVWQLNEEEVHLEAHIDFEKDLTLSQFNDLLGKIESMVAHQFGINHVNIQPEFGKCDPKQVIVQD